MNKNKKRLYITENEDGFKFSEKKRIVSFNRVAFLFFFILFIFLLYSTKIIYLGSSSPNQTYQMTKKTENQTATQTSVNLIVLRCLQKTPQIP